MKKLKVVILGCGWLGTQIGNHLSTCKGHEVVGSVRDLKKKTTLAKNGIQSFYLNIDRKSQISSEITGFTDFLILCLPPIQKENPEIFGKILTDLAVQFPVSTKVIYTSSIGIYPLRDEVFNEQFQFSELQKRSTLFQAEKQLMDLLSGRLTVLRLGGLIGPNRHPMNSLSGKSLAHDGAARINLIHAGDVCRAFESIIEQKAFGECFNLVHPLKLSKKEYYNSRLLDNNLPKISFGTESKPNRIVDGSRITKQLNFKYHFEL